MTYSPNIRASIYSTEARVSVLEFGLRRHYEVIFAQPFDRMSRQGQLHVPPFYQNIRVMILFLCDLSHRVGKIQSILIGLETEVLFDRPICLGPTLKDPQELFGLSLRHWWHSFAFNRFP